MTAHLDALVRELADAMQGNQDDLPVRLRKGVIFAQSPLTAKIGGSAVAVPVQATGPIPANGTVVWVLESGPRRVLLDANRGPFTPATERDTLVAAQRSQIGGFVGRNEQFRWEGGRLYWTGRLISISHGSGPHWSNGGWYGFYATANTALNGTVVPGYGGHGGFTFDGGLGIPLGHHQALYGVPVLGGSPTQTSLALVSYTSPFVVPPHWVLIAVTSESDGTVMLGNGQHLDPWRPVTDVGLQAGWSYYTGQSAIGSSWTARFRKMDGVVYMEGLLTQTGSISHAYTLPVGYRPRNGTVMLSMENSTGGQARADIMTSGEVHLYSAPVNGWVNTHASFVAEQ